MDRSAQSKGTLRCAVPEHSAARAVAAEQVTSELHTVAEQGDRGSVVADHPKNEDAVSSSAATAATTRLSSVSDASPRGSFVARPSR